MVCRALYMKGVLLIFSWKNSSHMGHKKNLARWHTLFLLIFPCKVHEYMLRLLIDSLFFALVFQVSKPLLRRTGDGRVLNWSTEEDDSLCTLQEVFERVSPRVGFNIELKFDDNIIYHSKDLYCALQAILQVRHFSFLHLELSTISSDLHSILLTFISALRGDELFQ